MREVKEGRGGGGGWKGMRSRQKGMRERELGYKILEVLKGVDGRKKESTEGQRGKYAPLFERNLFHIYCEIK